MKNRRFNIAAAVSLVLCATTIALWLRSFACETILLESFRGQFLLIGVDQAPSKAVRDAREGMNFEFFLSQLHAPPWPVTPTAPPGPAPEDHRLFGFSFLQANSGAVGSVYGVPVWIVGVPHWFVALLTVALPVVWLQRRRRTARRDQSNRCVTCGYDLRASPDRCPECGTTVTAPAAR